jgi:hypothetical protein
MRRVDGGRLRGIGMNLWRQSVAGCAAPMGVCVRAIALLVICAAALAQDTPVTEFQGVPAFQSKVNPVLVPVVVHDAHGRG